MVSASVAALAAGGADAAVVVLAEGLQDDFQQVLADATVPVRFVVGGATRQESVANGLAAIAADPELAGCRLVLVHDAARALVPPEVTARVIAAVRAGARGCVPVTAVVDTIREVDEGGSHVVDRSRLRAVQTPQGFDREVLVEAHARLRVTGEHVTDDAAAVEALGWPIVLVEGSREAFKITEPFDLAVAEALAGGR